MLLSAEVAPILSATPAVITAVARFLTVLLLPSSLKVLPRLPLLLTKLIEAWVASDRKAAFAMAAEVPVTTVPLSAVAIPAPAPPVTAAKASAIMAAPAPVSPSCL